MAVVATPAFTPNGGERAPASTFSIATATEGATIYYTYDPDEVPSPLTWTHYTAPVELATSTSIPVRAYAIKEGSTDSAVATATFKTQTVAPVFDPVAGKVVDGDTFELTSTTASATIRYTFGDTAPSTEWETYASAVDIGNASGQTVAVQAYASKSPMAHSDVTAATYYTVGYSSAVDASHPAILDTNASQGIGAVCEGIGKVGSDGASIGGSRIGTGSTSDLKYETNA